MLRSIFWKPYSHLLIIGDNANWAIDEETRELKNTADKLGIPTKVIKRFYLNTPQVVHYSSQFSLNDLNIYKSKHKISVDYFHGKPDQGDNFKKCFESLKRNHSKISKVRVSTKEMEGLILSSGIDGSKVVRIPIGINTDFFKPQTPESKKASRKALGIPDDSFVIGSFQKDGVGWGEGNEPKLIKGPDIFLKVIERLKLDIPNLHVLLSGPARGFVRSGLDKLGVAHTHILVEDYRKISDLYNSLDLYLITSREEGGPKSCLESMSKGIPLVTTEVGQCKDIVKMEQNGLLAKINDIEGLYESSKRILHDELLRNTLVQNGLRTARENSCDAQVDLWREYFRQLIK